MTPANNDAILERVRFEVPVAREINDLGYCAVDMHFHTNHSDSRTTVRAALSSAKRKGIGLAITDHNTIGGVLEAQKLAPSGVMVVPGVEVSAADGPHILLFFYSLDELQEFYLRELEEKKGESPYLATTLSTLDILDVTEDYNCIRAAAHPYGYFVFNRGIAKCIEKDYFDEGVISRFEAIEVLCGGMTRAGNLKAANLALVHERGVVGGTDGHLLWDLGAVLTCASSQGIEEFLDDIVDQRSFVVGREKNTVDKGVMGMMVLSRYLRYTVPSLAVHFRQNAPRIRRFMERQISGKKKAR